MVSFPLVGGDAMAKISSEEVPDILFLKPEDKVLKRSYQFYLPKEILHHRAGTNHSHKFQWYRGLIGMSKKLGVSSKQLLALCSILFTVYCLLSFLAVAAPVSADTVEPEWVARYDSPEDGHDEARAIVVDTAGYIYVSGDSSIIGTSTGTRDYFTTIKYDPAGHPLWIARYATWGSGTRFPHWVKGLAVDKEGNVYVTGITGNDYSNDYVTIKYDPNGKQLWVAQYNGPANGLDIASALAIDEVGNVYITGGSEGDYATIKYDPDGHQLWVASYRGADKSDNFPTAMALDNVGNVYVTGVSGSDYATVKYNSEGHQLWVARYNGPANLDDRPSALVVDRSGNIYVTGNSRGDNYKSDYATVKYRQEAEIKSSINQTTFGKGDTLTWDVIIGGSDRVDVYLAVVLPSGDFICLADTQVNTSAYNTAIPILQDWSILPGSYRIISYPFTGKEPRGEYQLYIIFTKPGANPLDRTKWVAYNASSFTIP